MLCAGQGPVVRVVLPGDVHAAAVACGRGRWEANAGVPNAAWYDEERMEREPAANIKAALCEAAVGQYTGLPAHLAVWPHSQHHHHTLDPDVGDNIEVRRVRTQTGPTLREHQVGHGFILWAAVVEEYLDTACHVIRLLGWRDYDEAWAVGYANGWGRHPEESRQVPWRSVLNHPSQWHAVYLH
jgi:hypothetical protein